MRDLTFDDMGMYKCEVSNENGADMKETFVYPHAVRFGTLKNNKIQISSIPLHNSRRNHWPCTEEKTEEGLHRKKMEHFIPRRSIYLNF